ncbi:putative cytochrome c oxidase subunit 5b isoform X2 [Glycine max]|uniref:putative cytochrome c oxidase subunit 5b isoform X2 n=1 Tax=Glycine max TaxID=3847 RepID=UPI0007191AEE|nr:putative cytochrome c oxidase subunit 5b isoform X2 [Glycine max]|eukprot:XP_014620654.1 putative cytochrome c oxidase subunit 5b isoform X2 [Glycine max]
MWRRLFSSSNLKALHTTLSPSRPRLAAQTLLARHFTAQSGASSLKKRVEDVVPIATGHEREEIQADLEGRDILEINHPVGPFGTKEAPAVVKSYFDRRIVGCPGDEEGEHDVVWFWLEKGKPIECPVCSQYFKALGPFPMFIQYYEFCEHPEVYHHKTATCYNCKGQCIFTAFVYMNDNLKIR